ncbi:Uncharacterized low-complexity proteins [Alteromonadaceae bacterium Bs31]|nr:Uncharacterized low-complexity proteins [Alteromonadaceae bacterium Bs31]
MEDFDPNKLVLQGSKIWNKTTAGKVADFVRPQWFDSKLPDGQQIKGRNKLDMSGMHFYGTRIHSAFAEGLNLSGSTFIDAQIEEGDFSRADFSHCTFKNTRFNKTIFTQASFSGASFVNCNLNRVNLTEARFDVKEICETVVYGISAWDLQLSEESKQSKLIIEKSYEFYSDFIARGELPLMVDDIELAQFVYYLSNHKKMRDTLNILNNRGVLLLGQFRDGGLERLYALREWLQARGYMPMIFDFTRPDSLSTNETIVTMAGLSKFVLADLAGPSVPAELTEIFSSIKRPLLAFGKHPYALFPNLMDQTTVVHIEGLPENLLQELETKLPTMEQLYKKRIEVLIERDKFQPSGA